MRSRVALRVLDHCCAPSRRTRREIDWADEARLALDEHQRLALVEGMIAEGHGIDADREEFLEQALGEAEAARRILAVDDDEIEPPASAQREPAPGPRCALTARRHRR